MTDLVQISRRTISATHERASDMEVAGSIDDAMQEVLDDYIEVHRHDIVEGREPLFTTRNQRVSLTALLLTVFNL